MKKELKALESPFQKLVRHNFLLFGILLFLACGEQVPLPKPRAYPKINLPSKEARLVQENLCNYSFEIPDYVVVQRDSLHQEEETGELCWFDLYYPDFDCRIHCSYYPITKGTPLEKLHSDAFRLAMEHQKKATYIDEMKVSKPNNVAGFIFNLEGPVATPFQFYLTDSVNHFMRGALYFNAQVRPDSLAPYYEFVKKDLSHMINTFAWSKDVLL